MRRSHVPLLIAILAASACGDLKDVMALSTAVQEKYHMPASVNLNNGSHLAITFQNAPMQSLKLDSAGMNGFARGVAAFATAHYPKAAELEDVTVGFATVSNTGPLTITRTEAPYRFLVSELR